MAYDVYFSFLVATASGLLALTAWQFWKCWKMLQLALEQVELHPIRHAISALPIDFSWSPIWQHSPRKRSYILFSRGLDCWRKLKANNGGLNLAKGEPFEGLATDYLDRVGRTRTPDPELYANLQKSMSEITESLMLQLKGDWSKGYSESLSKLEHDPKDDKAREVLPKQELSPQELKERIAIHLAEEFVALRCVAFVRYVMLQLRNLLTFILFGYVLLAPALGSYPFDSPQLVAWGLIVGLALLAIPVILAFLQMDRDATLSRITNTKAGELEWGFVARAASFGILPLLSVLGSHFPSVGQYLYAWVQPVLRLTH